MSSRSSRFSQPSPGPSPGPNPGATGDAGFDIGGIGFEGGEIVVGSSCTGAACHIAFITDGIPGCNFRTGDMDSRCVPNFLAHAIRLIFGVAGAICIIFILFSGYLIVIGNLPGGSTESGKNMLTWAIIGFIVCALSFFILDFIISAIAGF